MNYEDEVRTERDIRMSDYWCLFGVTLLYWDHILTLPAEIKYLWNRPHRSISSYMFFLNRYFTASTNIIVIVSRLGPVSLLESPSCASLQTIRDIIVVVAQVIVLLIMTMRIYALYERNKRLLWILLTILILGLAGSAVDFGMNGGSCAQFSLFYRSRESSLESRRCHTPRDDRQAAQAAVPWEAAFFYDTLIFSLALYKAYRTKKELGVRLPLLNIIVRDGEVFRNNSTIRNLLIPLRSIGSLYFGAMSLAGLANILTFYVSLGCYFLRLIIVSILGYTARRSIHESRSIASGEQYLGDFGFQTYAAST
ncbi:hypothetical protein VNI00_006170 [Paramarasmius palmivorus]|uniref:DUF6533 domain-containing protein n=1 Tax=Paramarasmius palmivorus TaxID=297713 RepID=A0AAW0D933_9AGAR